MKSRTTRPLRRLFVLPQPLYAGDASASLHGSIAAPVHAHFLAPPSPLGSTISPHSMPPPPRYDEDDTPVTAALSATWPCSRPRSMAISSLYQHFLPSPLPPQTSPLPLARKSRFTFEFYPRPQPRHLRAPSSPLLPPSGSPDSFDGFPCPPLWPPLPLPSLSPPNDGTFSPIASPSLQEIPPPPSCEYKCTPTHSPQLLPPPSVTSTNSPCTSSPRIQSLKSTTEGDSSLHSPIPISRHAKDTPLPSLCDTVDRSEGDTDELPPLPPPPEELELASRVAPAFSARSSNFDADSLLRYIDRIYSKLIASKLLTSDRSYSSRFSYPLVAIDMVVLVFHLFFFLFAVAP
jgi:hypothetical protein